MMKKYFYPLEDELAEALTRPAGGGDDLRGLCARVFGDVRCEGDEALRRYTREFDKVEVGDFRVGEQEFAEADALVDDELKKAIRLAAVNIGEFHAAQVQAVADTGRTGLFRCWQEVRAIGCVGLYVPGGSAPLFSTVLMLAIPARIAGCGRVVICTPPGADGRVNPAILWTAQLCGVTEIYKAGGIQAVAAMTLGTESIPQVYKIFGPGNGYVTAAKQYATEYGVAVDMPAGPSEVMVVADRTARPEFVAADLLSQAEHGPDSQVVLVTWEPEILDAVDAELASQLARLPRRETAAKALANSRCIVVRDRRKAMEVVNEYAPEHLILSVSDYGELVPLVENAGSVFLGHFSPESAGDYASGTNHTLPTAGFARSYSGIGVEAFTKKISFQEITRAGLGYLGPAIETMAAGEYLDAHRNAVTIRLKL